VPEARVPEWAAQCEAWGKQYPLIEAAHDDTPGYMNSYRLMAYMNGLLKPDAQVVVDTGSLMCPVFQAMRFRPPQRVYTAGCLGEMGNGLPGAIGVSFATGGEVLCLLGDGGAMMNIQELATVRFHNLPIKMMVFSNDGYSMIKGTFNTVKRPRVGVDRASGLGLPDFERVAKAFDILACKVRTWEEFKAHVGIMLEAKGPFLMEVVIGPEQEFVPRLRPINKDGVITPPRFCDLSPLDA
jgi:acetolactate synthase-1/2/3 large subunit